MSTRARPNGASRPLVVSTDPLAPEETETNDGSSGIRFEKRDAVARITIDRPAALNAYTTATLAGLRDAFREAALDDQVGVVVLTGTGTRAFCTGGDVKEYAERFVRRPRDYWKYMELFRQTVESILRVGKPTIARLNGIVIGGGNELHLACDLSVAAEHAVIGQVGVGVGSVAAGGATQWLPLVVGDRRARRMLLLNERVNAPDALDWGLVSATAPSVRHDGEWVSPPPADVVRLAQKEERGHRIDLSRVDETVDRLAARLLEMFPECLRYTKAQTNFWKELAWNQTVGHAQEWLALHFATAEPYEGMHSFVDKRPARVPEMRARLAAGQEVGYLHGAPVLACPACGENGLPEAFRYCGRCGELLRPASEGAQEP